MISTTSFFLMCSIATVLLVSNMMTGEASAFEPTIKEQKIIEMYVNVTIQIDDNCVDDNSKQCQGLEIQQQKLLEMLNDMGIFVDGQTPNLDHLTNEHDSTRAAAKAGIEPSQPNEECIADGCDSETMYVKAGYKDPYVLYGFIVYVYYAGAESENIQTGESTDAFYQITETITESVFPYCYTSSQDVTWTNSVVASYNMVSTLTDQYFSPIVGPFPSSHTSTFVWYDNSDEIVMIAQNSISSNSYVTCDLSVTSIS